MSTPEMKAAGVNSLIGTLRSAVDADRFESFIHALPAGTAALIVRPRLAHEWIPLVDVAPLHPVALSVLFDGRLAAMYELGHLQVQKDLNGMYRLFLRVASPGFIADRTQALYGTYTRDCGTLRLEGRTSTGLDLVIENRPHSSPAFYEALRGSIAGALELTGVKGLTISATDESNPHRRVFRAAWH